ncbi:hypothetical protein C0J52_02973, partial [Blattella germanica]
ASPTKGSEGPFTACGWGAWCWSVCPSWASGSTSTTRPINARRDPGAVPLGLHGRAQEGGVPTHQQDALRLQRQQHHHQRRQQWRRRGRRRHLLQQRLHPRGGGLRPAHGRPLRRLPHLLDAPNDYDSIGAVAPKLQNKWNLVQSGRHLDDDPLHAGPLHLRPAPLPASAMLPQHPQMDLSHLLDAVEWGQPPNLACHDRSGALSEPRSRRGTFRRASNGCSSLNKATTKKKKNKNILGKACGAGSEWFWQEANAGLLRHLMNGDLTCQYLKSRI